MRIIICQAIDCNCKATWRVVDRYIQQKQTHHFFFYYCDEHKKKNQAIKTVNHSKKYYPLVG